MEKRIQDLRHRIDVYRGLLKRGPSAMEAMRYLRRIMDAEAELERISNAGRQDTRRPKAKARQG